MTLPVAASIRIAKGFKQTILFSIIFGEIAVTWWINYVILFRFSSRWNDCDDSVIILIVTIFFKEIHDIMKGNRR